MSFVGRFAVVKPFERSTVTAFHEWPHDFPDTQPSDKHGVELQENDTAIVVQDSGVNCGVWVLTRVGVVHMSFVELWFMS